MKIQMCLTWVPAGKPPHKAFKDPACCRLLNNYVKKIAPFSGCDVTGVEPVRKSGVKIWFCDRARNKTPASSEDIARKLQTEMSSGTKELFILIGGADGFSADDFNRHKPDYVWSFGSLTLPHELASVVAAEQIYRAFAILNGHPYHKGH